MPLGLPDERLVRGAGRVPDRRSQEEDRDRRLLVGGDRDRWRLDHGGRRRRGLDHGDLPQRAQRPRDLGAVEGAEPRIAGEHAVDEVDQRLREPARPMPEPWQLAQRDPREHSYGVLVLEGGCAREALEQYGPEREHIGPCVERPRADDLLGRRVPDAAHEHAGPGERGQLAAPGDAEVDQPELRQRAADEEDVARLEVAMDDPALVQDPERLGQVQTEPEALAQRQALPLEALVERFALQPLHRQVRLAGREQPVRDVADDVRVSHAGQELRFTLEAPAIQVPILAQHLDRDGLPAVPVDRAVDLSHPSGVGEAIDGEAPVDPLAGVQDRAVRGVTLPFCRRRMYREVPRRRPSTGRCRAERHLAGGAADRALDPRRGVRQGREQRLHLGAKRGCVPAEPIEHGAAFFGGGVRRRVEHRFDLPEALGGHGSLAREPLTRAQPGDRLRILRSVAGASRVEDPARSPAIHCGTRPAADSTFSHIRRKSSAEWKSGATFFAPSFCAAATRKSGSMPTWAMPSVVTWNLRRPAVCWGKERPPAPGARSSRG